MQHDTVAATPARGDAIPAAAVPFIEIRDVHKSFGGVRALKGVSFAIEPGQIYHLMGENGCGKSTLIKILSGAQPADSGDILVNGRPSNGFSPVEALAAGIETVYQDLSLLPNLTVAENIGLTQQLVASSGHLFRRLDRSRMRGTAEAALATVGLPTTSGFLATRIDELPIASRQLVAIARAIASDARLVIMDEPTTALTKREVDNLIAVVNRLRAGGVAVLFVTHKLDECKSIGGRAVIMRDGQKVAEVDVADHSKAELGFWMTGKMLDEARYRQAPKTGDTLIAVEKLGRRAAFSDVSFSVRKGEIVGITGLLDSGRNELALALAGVRPADAGTIQLDGAAVTLKDPGDAIAAGIGYVPEDRLSEGLFLEKSIEDNVVMAVLDRLRGALGLVSARRSRALAEATIADLQVATPDVTRPVQSLSGGNQQRVLIGRWLTIHPKLLILHGPTVGVDVGSKDTIFRIIQRLADEGMGVVIISDDLPELLQNCDRILVMRKGRLAESFEAEGLAEETLYGALVDEARAGAAR
ncbi:sugar ABC transporter ATP-binding protein [Mangrovicella endophytica]|uniref:sugar ABC transporter ATP-binding protein n=1 Tax=Mangrovicella endophytica TaxID=2066697 RepID=UPI000C9DBA5B|nr:sugar ABC transporter ATP-binding protein [Mangrovicella endophytica]